MKFNFKVNQPKTWIIDLDGTIVSHNGHKTSQDSLLPGVSEFFKNLDQDDFILITTARDIKYKPQTLRFLNKNHIRYNHIIFNLPTGERILINDMKPDNSKTAYCVNLIRNKGLIINEK